MVDVLLYYTENKINIVDLPLFFGDFPSFSICLPGRPFSATCGEKNHGDFHGEFK